MSHILQVLRDLQAIDREILRYRRYLTEIPQEVDQKKRETREIDRQIETRREEKKKHHLEVVKFEKEVRAIDEKIEKLVKQQNEVKTNREYKAIQNEKANFEVEKSAVEEKVLVEYTAGDEIEAAIKDLDERKKLKEKELAQAQGRADKDCQELEGQIGELQKRREDVARRIDPKTLGIYQELLEDKEGLALAAVVKSVCQGCSFRVLPNVLNRLHEDTDLVRCSHCGRILHLADA